MADPVELQGSPLCAHKPGTAMIAGSGAQDHVPNLVGESMPQKCGKREGSLLRPGSDVVQKEGDPTAGNAEGKRPPQDADG